MTADLTDEQTLLRDTARRFLEREVAPLVADHEARGVLPEGIYAKLVAPSLGIDSPPLARTSAGARAVASPMTTSKPPSR